MSKISQSIIEKIDKKHIEPIPKWQFITWHVLLWVAFVFSIFLGSIAFGVLLLNFIHIEWEAMELIEAGPVGGFFLMLPYLWFILVILMVFISKEVFSLTKHGYKYGPYIVVGLSVLLSMILGSIMYITKTADFFEDTMRLHLKPYAQLQDLRDQALLAPENGLLVGRIAEIKSDKLIIVNDLTEQKWEVDISDAITFDILPKVGSPVLITGEQTGEDSFKAEILKIRRSGGPMMMTPKGPGNGFLRTLN